MIVGEAELFRFFFSSCDAEGLPVQHVLPSGSDERRFVVQERRTGDGGGNNVLHQVYYLRGGVYRMPITLTRPVDLEYRPVLCPFDVSPLGHDMNASCEVMEREVLHVRGVCPVGREVVGEGYAAVCGCRRGEYFKAETDECLPCADGTSSAVGSHSCPVCAEGYYRSTAKGSEAVAAAEAWATCTTCAVLLGAVCAWNSTGASLSLAPGYWRASISTLSLVRCLEAQGHSPCVGGHAADLGRRRLVDGGGGGYCAPGHTGPMCEVCVAPRQFFSREAARCTECFSSFPPATIVFLVLMGAALVATAIAAVLLQRGRTLPRREEAFRRALLSRARRLAALWRAAGMRPKLKLLVGAAQCLAIVPSGFRVSAPEHLAYLKRVLELPTKVSTQHPPSTPNLPAPIYRLQRGAAWPAQFAARLVCRLCLPAAAAHLRPVAARAHLARFVAARHLSPLPNAAALCRSDAARVARLRHCITPRGAAPIFPAAAVHMHLHLCHVPMRWLPPLRWPTYRNPLLPRGRSLALVRGLRARVRASTLRRVRAHRAVACRSAANVHGAAVGLTGRHSASVASNQTQSRRFLPLR